MASMQRVNKSSRYSFYFEIPIAHLRRHFPLWNEIDRSYFSCFLCLYKYKCVKGEQLGQLVADFIISDNVEYIYIIILFTEQTKQ